MRAFVGEACHGVIALLRPSVLRTKSKNRPMEWTSALVGHQVWSIPLALGALV